MLGQLWGQGQLEGNYVSWETRSAGKDQISWVGGTGISLEGQGQLGVTLGVTRSGHFI